MLTLSTASFKKTRAPTAKRGMQATRLQQNEKIWLKKQVGNGFEKSNLPSPKTASRAFLQKPSSQA
jgi:hypothetical protein